MRSFALLRVMVLGMIGIAVFFVFVVGVSHIFPKNDGLHALTLMSIDGSNIPLRVEFATTEAEREKGLMDRTSIDHGMLFIFETTQPLNFWMKNTLIPLDIAFFDASGGFVSAETMLPCVSDPCAIYSSALPAKYALEMQKGFLNENRVGMGWTMQMH